MSDHNQIKGKANQAAGAVREKAGEITGNEEMQGEGRAQQAKGNVQEIGGKAEKTLKDAAGKVGDALRK
jgi:uncharacterized protein YjbJ (UPF0337 family)